MSRRQCYILALALAFSTVAVAQSRWPKPQEQKIASCPQASGTKTYPVGKYTVKLVSSDDDQYSNGQVCRAYLEKPDTPEVLLLEDAMISVLKGTGDDVFGHGNPGLVLESFSGGAHCCWNYVLADLGDSPAILPATQNETRFMFFKDARDRKYKILTRDGAFDYFDDMCHACTPFPTVVLEVDGGRLRDVSAQFVAEYDEVIAKARADINQDELARFAMASNISTHDQAWGESQDLREAILKIILSYLYSGREKEAWKSLDEMWPASDRQRIKDLILQTRSRGILSEAAGAASKSQPASVP